MILLEYPVCLERGTDDTGGIPSISDVARKVPSSTLHTVYSEINASISVPLDTAVTLEHIIVPSF